MEFSWILSKLFKQSGFWLIVTSNGGHHQSHGLPKNVDIEIRNTVKDDVIGRTLVKRGA